MNNNYMNKVRQSQNRAALKSKNRPKPQRNNASVDDKIKRICVANGLKYGIYNSDGSFTVLCDGS